MGSFSSKMCISSASGCTMTPEGETSASDTTDTSTQVQGDATNGADNSPVGATSHEQPPTPRVNRSYSWLASSPISLDRTAKEQKGKRPKKDNVIKYNNAKYLKSWQHSADLPPSNTKRQSQPDANSPSTSSAGNHLKCAMHDEGGHEAMVNSANVSAPPWSTYSVGFGVEKSGKAGNFRHAS